MSYPPSPESPHQGGQQYPGQGAQYPDPAQQYAAQGQQYPGQTPPGAVHPDPGAQQGYGAPGGYAGYGPAVQYATWLQRVGAYLLDGLCVAPFSILAAVLGHSTGSDGLPHYNAFYYLFSLLGLVVTGYNRWYQAGKTGQSWGKKALGIRLLDEATGQPIGGGKAFLRDLAHIVDAVICYIGFLFPLWDAKKQTLADKIVKTVVVH
jgi:uncharacterized RDD family membrane protein YckC